MKIECFQIFIHDRAPLVYNYYGHEILFIVGVMSQMENNILRIFIPNTIMTVPD